MSEDRTQTASETALVQHNGRWFLRVLFPNQDKFEAIRNLPLNDDDTMIVTFPKSGTSWMQQIVWLILNGVDTNHDDERRPISHRIKFLEFGDNVDRVATENSPKVIMSHLPHGYLPANVAAGHGKVIYLARNAKDTCVSYYYFSRMIRMFAFHGDFSEFYEMFKTGKVAWGPWQDHVGEFWEHRHDNNVMFLFYEELINKPKEMVEKVAEFLGRKLSEEHISAIVQKTTFSSMKNDPSTNYTWLTADGLANPSEAPFMRKGEVGDWVNHFTADMEAEIHQLCIEPLAQQGLTFTDTPQK